MIEPQTKDKKIGFDCPAWPPAIPELADLLTELIDSGAWGRYQAEPLAKLAAQIASFLEVKHVRLVSSGSIAVELALRACGIGVQPARRESSHIPSPGTETQEVICPVLDYPGNARAVRLLGAIPILVDTLPDRWTIDPDAVLSAATPNTKAVIASHLYGESAMANRLRTLCDHQGWFLIEDVCQMPGGKHLDRPLGSFGHVAAWSFGGSKPLTAGCGGAVTTDDSRIAQRLAAYADRPSDSFPLSPLQATVLLPQWQRLDDLAERQKLRLTRLIELCRDATPLWRWPSLYQPGSRSTFYKVPVSFKIKSSETALGMNDPCWPNAIRRSIRIANRYGIPAGEAFRVPERLAKSRGRIVSSENASAMVSTSWLLDHRALAGSMNDVDALAHTLVEVYRQAVRSDSTQHL